MTAAMSIVLDVGLMSGKTVSLEAGLDESVGSLKCRAQTALAVRKGRLLDSSKMLDEEQTIRAAKLLTGTLLTLQISEVQVLGTPKGTCSGAFSAILPDGLAATWGNSHYGGDSRTAQDQPKNVQQIQASHGAFAAILSDGSVVTWGNQNEGGDCRAVQDQLKGVKQIQSSSWPFAAILSDGSVVTWGDRRYGGDSRDVQDRLKGVQQIQASHGAFAAILSTGSVVTWGNQNEGGDSRAVQDQPKNVQQIQASHGAFAAILSVDLLLLGAIRTRVVTVELCKIS